MRGELRVADNMEMVLSEYLTQHHPARILFEKLKELGDVYLIGGVLREIKDNGRIKTLRDIDIVLDTEKEIEYRNIIREYMPEHNRFGGYKVICQDLIIDVWLMRQTWAYSANVIKCDRREYSKLLPKTVFLNMDSIVYDMKKNQWYDEEYQRAMKTRILDVVLEENPFLELNIVRSFVIMKRYKMSFSAKLKTLIKDYVYSCAKSEKEAIERLYEIQNKRYKKEVLSKKELEIILSEVISN